MSIRGSEGSKSAQLGQFKKSTVSKGRGGGAGGASQTIFRVYNIVLSKCIQGQGILSNTFDVGSRSEVCTTYRLYKTTASKPCKEGWNYKSEYKDPSSK